MPLFTDDDLAQPSRLSAGNARMLQALGALGCGKHFIAAFLALENVDKNHIRFLTGPIVQHRSPWAQTTPEWLYQAVTGDRLRIILEEHARGKVGWQVGPAELTAVMYPATMEAPLLLEYAEIYLRASAQANARHTGQTVPEVWAAVGHEPARDRLVTNPSGRYHQAYRQLCCDIRRRVVNAGRTEAPTPATPDHEEAIVTTAQLSLF